MSRLIDADKLHSEFMKMAEFKPNSETGEPTCGCTRRLVFHISEGIRKINEQPTVDAEPIRHGKWINDGIDKWKCSLCQKGNIYAFKWSVDEGYELQDNYCPNCGALMDGEEEDE